MRERQIGYVLLSVGLIIMVASVFSMVGVFTGRMRPVQLATFKGVGIDPSSFAPQIPGLPNSSQEPKKVELISADMINTSINLFAHLTLAGFLLSFGGKLASLGNELLRPIIVKTGDSRLPAEPS